MGANCSHDSNERYEVIKNELKKSTCLKLHAVDGLLPKKEGNPIILMGEHHHVNEGSDCLSAFEIVQKVVSNCEKNKSPVYFLYENPVISDNPFFEKENPSIPFMDGQDQLDNIEGTRAKIFLHSKEFKNIKPQPIEIFGRMRHFNYNREIRNHVHTQNVAINEVKEFWKNIGYPDDFISFISPKAMTLSEETTNVFFSKFPNSFLTRTEVLEMFTCVYLAKLSLIVNEDTISKDAVIKYFDKFIEIFMSEEPELYNIEQFPELVGDIEERRFSLRHFWMFELIAIAGDMIAYEYISYLKKDKKGVFVLVHAGFNHTNRIRKWLLNEYNSDFEKVTDLALADVDFNFFR